MWWPLLDSPRPLRKAAPQTQRTLWHTCVQLLLNDPPLHARDDASLALVTFVALAARCGVVANSVREIRSL